MTVAIIAVVVVVLTLVVVKVSEHLKHPENITQDRTTGDPDPSTSDDLYGDVDRPAGPDAEDPPTVLPNRGDESPPP
jgi:hypothetical protein